MKGNQIKWINNEKTVLVIRIPEYWNWDEMRKWLLETQSILDGVSEPVAVLLDFQKSTFTPREAVYNIHRILRYIHKNADPIVLTRLSLGHMAVLDALFRLYPQDASRFVIYDDDVNWVQTT